MQRLSLRRPHCFRVSCRAGCEEDVAARVWTKVLEISAIAYSIDKGLRGRCVANLMYTGAGVRGEVGDTRPSVDLH